MLGNALLQGEKVFLDAVRREDVPQFGVWFADLEFLGYLGMGALFPNTEDDELDWYERQRITKDQFTFAIRRMDTRALIGSTSLNEIGWKNRTAVFGIAIGEKSVWGQGYGTDATRVILRYAFLELNLNRVELSVYSFNERALKSYAKVGFVLEGSRRQAIYRDGHYHDVHLMSILRDEWQEKQ